MLNLKPGLLNTPRWAIALGIAPVLISGTGAAYYYQQIQSAPAPVAPAPVLPQTVNALGRLEPAGEAIRISQPSSPGGAYRVESLQVKLGDRVQTGQIIAVLDHHNRRQQDVEAARQRVASAQARLNQVLAGAPAGDIAAQQAAISRLEAQLQGDVATQQASIARLEAEVRNAEAEYQRHDGLFQEGAISTSDRDSKSLVVETARERVTKARAALQRTQQTLQRQIQEARATLDRVAEVRPTDVAAAQAEVDAAQTAVAQAEAELETAYVQSPRDARVLRVFTQEGESVGVDGIVELGETDQMYAVAEVYEGDIGRVQVGQLATITADPLLDPLQGTVEQIGWVVADQGVLDTDPVASTDARVVEVKVRLDSEASQTVAQFSNLQVDVEISL
ncbi:MAG: ABC exporter membrane fusion protein [Cyanobacteria bacterium P01_A01_bin.135]